MAAALFPCTSILGEFVKGIRTSQIPISSSWGFRSSVMEGQLSVLKGLLKARDTYHSMQGQQHMPSFRSEHSEERLTRDP